MKLPRAAAPARYEHLLIIQLGTPSTTRILHRTMTRNCAWSSDDLKDWPISSGPISGNQSSPRDFRGVTGQRNDAHYKSQTLDFHLTLKWLAHRNDIRATLALTANVAPWFSNRDYASDRDQDLQMQRLQWAVGLLHDRHLYLNVMIFRSDRPWTDDEIAFAHVNRGYRRMMPIKRPATLGMLGEQHLKNPPADWEQLPAKLNLR
jgi:hypothetical protein